MTLQNGSYSPSSHITRGKLAIASLLLISFGLSACQPMPNTTQSTPTLKSGYQNIFTLQPSMCFDDAKNDDIVNDANGNMTIGEVRIQSCDKPHDNEVFYSYTLSEDTAYEDTDSVTQEVDAQCAAAFVEYVGESALATLYNISYIMPTLESWRIGDREVLCFTYHSSDSKLTLSLRRITALPELL